MRSNRQKKKEKTSEKEKKERKKASMAFSHLVSAFSIVLISN